ncbi:MAG: WbuC family cupin fold metalloprotein [Sulfuricella sp.]
MGQPVSICREQIEILKQLARYTSRTRARICAHPDTANPLHEMIILHARDAYVRPHRHPGKSESFHVIEGDADIILFDDDGKVENVIPMGEKGSGKAFYYRLNQATYHSLLIRSDIFIFHETTNGPFQPGASEFAPWAPLEEDRESVERFMNQDFQALCKP